MSVQDNESPFDWGAITYARARPFPRFGQRASRGNSEEPASKRNHRDLPGPLAIWTLIRRMRVLEASHHRRARCARAFWLVLALVLGPAWMTACGGSGKSNDLELLLKSSPPAQELPLGLSTSTAIEAIMPPPALGGVSYQLTGEGVSGFGLVIAVYANGETAARVFASPAPGKGIVGLVAPGIRAVEVEAPRWEAGPTVRCFEAPTTAYHPLDATKVRECDVVFQRFIVSVGLGRPGDEPLPPMKDEIPLLQAAVQHVDRALGRAGR